MPAFITVPLRSYADGYPQISSKVRIDNILSITPHVDSRYIAPGQTEYTVNGCEISLGSDHGVVTSLSADEVEALVEAAYAQNAEMDRQEGPTTDAYMRATRALHWRTEQIRGLGQEPIALSEDMPHYPPEGYFTPRRLTIRLTGPAGSGKTRWARYLRLNPPFSGVSFDVIDSGDDPLNFRR